ncbi:BCD family MFS transporter [Cyanobium sp. CH-040]|uniref:BCD family MFS transporter n=1 Tax=Cyanobium sp. CH-040 TaxID=2823708 RepID=UPI0020CF0B22|nr:BCD family MFS transporter [Cyanobium sp. CH-040]MCP9928977.1 BCD family MFS transporter [Cyanobium sp. CH-040]
MTALSSSAAAHRLGLPSTLRMGLFQGCLGCLAVIFAGLMNRVMISELGFPGLLVGAALACEQFVAPARVLFGQLSDTHPVAGRHRVPYIWLGAALFCTLAVLSVPLIFRVAALLGAGEPGALAGAIAALCGLFAAYGLAISMASTPYLALLIDSTDEQERPRAVGIIWCLLTVGIVVGAIATSIALRGLDGVTDPELLQPALLQFMLRVAGVILAITVIATLGIERPRRPLRSAPLSPQAPTSSAGARTASRDDAITLRQCWALVTSSRQVLVFFLFLVFFTLGLFLQDPVLESYGAEVFGMSIAATASLNALWGVGTLGGLLIAGLWIVPRLGKFGTARLGCQLIIATLAALLLTGFTAQVPLLRVVMVLFGLAAGVGTNSALVLMLDLTLPEAAGTFVGVWGLAQALSRALGKVVGGGLLDLGRWLQLQLTGGTDPFPAYALVLGVELLVAATALALLARVNLRQFREDTGRSLSRVLALELG